MSNQASQGVSYLLFVVLVRKFLIIQIRDFTTDDIRGTYSSTGTSLSNYYRGTYEEPSSSTQVGNWNVVGLEMLSIDETTYDFSSTGPLFAFFYSTTVNSDTDENAFNFLADLIFE